MKPAQRAFTLIEVLIAIVILAGSMVVLISMVSASVARSVNDKQHFYATLAARSIMSAIELKQDIDNQETIKPVLDLLEEYNAFNELDDESRLVYQEMEAALVVQDLEIPGLLGAGASAAATGGESQTDQPLKLQKLALGIRWGEGEEQHLDIYYALPRKE
jgi:prepilin-type N-terminal cleavage/methylation domain-containing protein